MSDDKKFVFDKSGTRLEGDAKIVELPFLAIRNTIVFPVLAFPINVGRPKSLSAVDASLESDSLLGVVAQHAAKTENPGEEELYRYGTVVKIVKTVKLQNNKLNVIIQGVSRVKILEFIQTEPMLVARVEVIDEEEITDDSLDSLVQTLREMSQKIIELSPQIPSEASFLIRSIDNPGILCDIIAFNLGISLEEKQALLETLDIKDRMEKVVNLLANELQVLELNNKIQSDVKGEMDKAQREYFLREQLKAIQKELGEPDDRGEEAQDLKDNIKKAKMPNDVEKVAFKELKRMSRMSPGAAEYTVSRTYIDTLIELPWVKSTSDNLDLTKARAILDEDHYGLEKVKKRIIEYLAVAKLKKDLKGPILCFAGPPGVGKTSLGKSIARALGRKFMRISLGGVRDEAEIRGHRRTYIGSMPGKVIKGLKKVSSSNPVFVLDEVDKLGNDYRGDPSSALLEVLDPEQNDSFTDHYLDVPFDLSKILFIATANRLDTIPAPLRDRMEIIEIPGYTEEEKIKIAQSFLIPEQLAEHGINEGHASFTRDALQVLIGSFTREAGVRSLKREIAACARWVARQVADDKFGPYTITEETVIEILGQKKFFQDIAERTQVPGVVTGMAWTPSGGDILFIEATKMKGKGRLILTGQLGDVMKESTQIALSWIQNNAESFGLEDLDFDTINIHIHVPSGSIPKDGPSAGVTMMTAMISLLTNRPVSGHLSMTGEITLRGNVLQVGGVKEKIMAAARAGIKEIMLPYRNEKDLEDVPPEILKSLSFHFPHRMEDVLDVVFKDQPIKREKKDDDIAITKIPNGKGGGGAGAGISA